MIRKGMILSILPLAVMAGFGVWAFNGADPNGMYPVHWGFDGQPDRFARPAEAFFVLPAIALGVTAFMSVIPLFDPRGDNIRRSAPFYLTVWIAVLVFMAVVQAALALSAMRVFDPGYEALPRVIGCGVALVLLVMGNALGKARPNWFAGVRTPWTLSSDLSWDKTHRLTGRLMVAVGALCAVGAWLLPPTWLLPLLLVGSLGVGAFSVIYSWMVWRTAPDRRNGPQAVDG